MQTEIGFWALLGTGTAMSFLIGVLTYLTMKYRTKFLNAQEARRQSMDLELATTDQLLEELKRRPSPYILLRTSSETIMGGEMMTLEMDVHNIPTIPAVGMLNMAAQLSMKELRSTPEGRAFLEFLENQGEDS